MTHADRFCCVLGFIYCLNHMEKSVLPFMEPELHEQFKQQYQSLLNAEELEKQEKQRQVELEAKREMESHKPRPLQLGLGGLRQLIAAPPAYVSYILPISLALAAMRDSTPLENRNDDYIVNWLLAAVRERNPDGSITQPYLISMINAMINSEYCFKMACEICSIGRFLGIASFAMSRCQNIHRLLRVSRGHGLIGLSDPVSNAAAPSASNANASTNSNL